MSRRLRHHISFKISIRPCDASREAERGLGQQHLTDITVELATTAEGVPGMVRREDRRSKERSQ